jgi:hypothetical protein
MLSVEVEVNLRLTVSLPVSLGVGLPSRAHNQTFVFCLTRGWVYNLPVQLLQGLARGVVLGSKSHRTQDYILLSHLRLSQLGEPGLRIYIPLVFQGSGPVIPLDTGFPVVASYVSQDCSGGILTRLHTGLLSVCAHL